MDPAFEWDPAKAEANLLKHGVDFETARSAFFDPFAITDQDRIEDGVEIVRIISARRATRGERRRYEDQLG